MYDKVLRVDREAHAIVEAEARARGCGMYEAATGLIVRSATSSSAAPPAAATTEDGQRVSAVPSAAEASVRWWQGEQARRGAPPMTFEQALEDLLARAVRRLEALERHRPRRAPAAAPEGTPASGGAQ